MSPEETDLSCLCVFIVMIQQPPNVTHFPYTTLFRSWTRLDDAVEEEVRGRAGGALAGAGAARRPHRAWHRCGLSATNPSSWRRSEEHTSELQSQSNLVCRLLLEKKKN